METETTNKLTISAEDFKLIKSFLPSFTRAAGIQTNDYVIDWNSIMPVVEKIRTTGYSNEISFGITDSYSNNGTPDWAIYIGAEITRWKKDEKGELVWPNTSYKLKMETIWFHHEKTLIHGVYKAVLEFIKWYNNQKENGNRNS